MTDPGPDPRVGSRFGPYRLTRLLGRGAAGEVYAAEDTRDGGTAAVKLIGEQLSGDARFRTRVQEGVAAGQRLTEPHVVAVDETGEADGVMYLAMRLIAGTDLATLLADSGPLSPPRAVAIVQQIGAALDAAHAEGITHGDVKPENILVTADDFAYLVDFGIARAVQDAAPDDDGSGPPADVHALARVLERCLAGARPGWVSAALHEVAARGPAEKPRSAGELADAAGKALRPSEQHQVARILRRGSATPEPVGGSGASRFARLSPVGPTLPSELIRSHWYTPAVTRLRRRRKPILVGAAALTVVTALVGVGYLVARPPQASSAAAPRQVVLPFADPGFRLSPGGVALDAGGDVYVTSQGVAGRVVKLPAGSATAKVLPFHDLYQPQGVAVDTHGGVYFSDFNNRVVKLEPGSENQVVLPFTGLSRPAGLAVDSAGNVYVADRGNNQVVKLDTGVNVQTVLPFGGLRGPAGVAVDNAGGVYVTDTDNNRVLKLPDAGGDQVVLPFAGIVMPWGIGVGSDGSVYVTEYRSNKVAKLAAGAVIPAVLPFTGLNTPSGVVVDNSGNVYVADRGNDRVLKLAG